MQRNRFVQVSAAGIACAAALLAADFWKTKDSSQWSSDEVNKILSDSPWAKEKTITPQGAGQRRSGGNRRGGFGFPGGGGIGFPGGGYPGGGYPGGGGYPRGGGGYPGGGSGNPDDTARNEPMNLTIRWESAAPVQAALTRQGGIATDDAKTVAGLSQKDYVITVLGYRMPAQRNRYGSSDDQNSSDDRNSQTNDRLRTQFLDAAQLTPKNGHSIYAEDVQFEGPNGSGAIRFLFPRTNLITANDKDVDFVLEMRGVKVEEKFHLADMQYEGKLAL